VGGLVDLAFTVTTSAGRSRRPATPVGVEPAGPACNSVEVSTLLTATSPLSGYAAEDRPWQDIPGVVLVGILMGLGFLIVALRAMFKKK
jgi:hypothetical protein